MIGNLADMDLVELLKALFIGIVEGVTEWLPISSTGHMILVDEFVKLKVSPAFLKLFLVVIQLGAIMAVLLLYREKLNPFSRRKDAVQRRSTMVLWLKVLVASVPAAVVGLLLDDWVGANFYTAVVVAAALIVYGVAFIVIERLKGDGDAPVYRPRHLSYRESNLLTEEDELDKLSFTKAIGIGCFQCLAIIPGTSRSGSTILGGRILGVSRRSAAEFSFFLAIPIMFGWSLLKVVKTFVLDNIAVNATEWGALAVGIVVAFVVSVLAIKFLMGYIKHHSFEAFGWYRVVLGLLLLLFFLVLSPLLF
jgi:undecaprenyl-diphosphatase